MGLPADELLNHGAPRLVYGAALIENLQEYLLGLARRPKYIFSQQAPVEATRRIVQWWLERWAVGRVRREDVLKRIARETLEHPIEHAARVVLPRRDLDQGRLF